MFEYMNMDMNMTLFHGVAMILLWTTILFLVITLFTKDKETNSEKLLNILNERFAKGEISKEEYKGLKESLID